MIPVTITPLIMRHVTDAAFYWLQLDQSETAFRLPLHQALAGEHKKLAKYGKIAPDGSMSMDDAMDAAADSHQDAFPASKCSKKCIRAQLEPYYRTCRGGRPGMVDEQAKRTLPSIGKTAK